MLLVAWSLVGILAQSAGLTFAPAVLTGRVMDGATGAGVADARVILLPMPRQGRPTPFAPDDRDPPMTVTDDEGRYSFDNVAAGRYRVNVLKPGFVLPPGQAFQVVELRARQHLDVGAVTVQRGATIAGRVLDERGAPLVRSRVTALRRETAVAVGPASRAELFAIGATADTDDLGAFRLFGLAPGEYVVGARTAPMVAEQSAARATIVTPTYYPGTPDVDAAQRIVVTWGQTYGEVAIQMRAVPAFQVSGIVRNTAGAPVRNALVVLQPTVRNPRGALSMTTERRVHTDATGRFAIVNVTADSYLLSVAPPIVIAQDTSAGGNGVGTPKGISSGIVGGFIGGGITTETRSGVTTQWRDDRATRVPVTLVDADVSGLDVIIDRTE